MTLSIAPTTSLEKMTLVGTLDEWQNIVKKMSMDRGYKDVAAIVKPQIDKNSNIQRITLPLGHARKVLLFCGISW